VFTGEGRRRYWSLDEKLSLVAQMATVDNISALARRHALRPSQLFTWRRELRYAAEATASPAFVPAVIEDVPADTEPTRAPVRRHRSSPCRSAIELKIDGVVMKIAPGADADTISAVIAALRATR
jgi:transposase